MSVEKFEVGKLYRLAINSENPCLIDHTGHAHTGHIYMILDVDTRTYYSDSVWMVQAVLPNGVVHWSYLTLRNWELVETS